MDPVPVGETETLARFLTQSNHFNTGGATHRAFMPDPHDDLSVSRVDHLSQQEIRVRGEATVEERKGTVYGWARLNVAAVLGQGLKIQPDEPPPGHAIIVGWPELKEDRKLIAIELAKASQLNKAA